MSILFNIAPFALPVSPSELGGRILERLEAEPDTLAIAVVDDNNRPVGIIERNSFLVRMAGQFGHALWAKRPVSEWMNPSPLVADGNETVDAFCGEVLQERASDLLHGFIVTREGAYCGVGTMLGLLQASALQARRRAAEMERLAQEARNATQTVQDALDAKGRFLAVMSHEIRTPLNGVLSVAEIVRRKCTQPELMPFLETIVQSGDILLRLLNDALDLTRAETSGLALDLAPFRPSDLVEEATRLWSAHAELKGVNLVCRFKGKKSLQLLGDRLRLSQVLNNLIGNALKFTNEGDVRFQIGVSGDTELATMSVSVTDNGPGIPVDRVETIFEPFQQTEEGIRRGGAGLGLAVCRQLAQRMEGTIGVEANPDGGATFVFEVRLPVANAKESQGTVRNVAEAKDEKAINVLVVDDNATNRLVAKTLCEIYGCNVDLAEDGAEAVDLARTGGFDLILMDIKMPGMDGVEATRRIRSGGGLASRVPILAVTANADPADAVFYRSCGVNGVVEKPIRPEKLIAAMSAVLQIDTQGEEFSAVV